MPRKPKLAVWKFASCDGCQLTLLDCEDELLQIADEVEIAYFLEATRGTVRGPYDLSLVEGSVTTAHDAERIQEVRRASRALVTIGACATAGGIQALRNFADVGDFLSIVYASPEYVSTLATSTPISAHVPVDFELQGCPIDKRQLLEVLSAFLHRREPRISAQSVCVECKRRGNVCVMVAHGTPCLGPGHARRLRGHLPRVRPRLLRLLRPQGDAEHVVARRRVARPRLVAAPAAQRVRDVQRGPTRVPARERGP